MATKKKATKVEEVNTTPEMEFEDEVKEDAMKDPTITALTPDGEPEQEAEVLHPITKVCVECGKEFTISPAEQKIEERKADLMEQEFQLKKRLSDIENPDAEDDGFLEALKESAQAVWEET